MRKTFVVVMAAVLAFGLAFAAPAAAAPENNPQVYTYEMTCDGSTVDVIAKIVPGWLAGGPPGTTPSLLMGGKFDLYEGGTFVLSVENPPPPGLEGQLVACHIEGPFPQGSADFYWMIDGYVLLTPHA